MRIAVCQLQSISTYSPSRPHAEAKKDREGPDDYEKRTWKNRLHVNSDGGVFIPPMAFKWALDGAAKRLRMKVPGKKGSEFGKIFTAGIMIMDPVVLPVKADDVQGEWLFLNADGKRGSGTRVWRCMPAVPEWKGTLTVFILDDTITEEVFKLHLIEAGNFVGVGRFRPERGGFYGRFKVLSVKFQEQKQEAA